MTPPLAALTISPGMWIAAFAGLLAGAAVNWATYSLAFYRRAISPWSPADPQTPPRRTTDRIPVLGWWGLRRESTLHGRGFWIRPLLVELAMAAGLAALYWWEVDQQQLVAPQLAAWGANGAVIPLELLLPTFVSHALLLTLLAATSLIDVDEKTVPSAITDIGTLVGLALAAIVPAALLPDVAAGPVASPAAQSLNLKAFNGTPLLIAPTTPVAPLDWPAALAGAPHWQGLAVGLGSYALWCFALTPRRWRTRRGLLSGLKVLSARVARELNRPPLKWVALAGAAAIVAIWLRGGAAWLGLLTALVGMIGASAMVWGVRIVGTLALRREAMGFGDVTFMMMVGAFLGWQSGVVIFFLAPFAGLAVGLLQLALRRDDEIPYVPYLALATLVVMLSWGRLWHEPPGGLKLLLFEFGPWVPAALLGCLVLLGVMLTVWQFVKTRVLGKQ